MCAGCRTAVRQLKEVSGKSETSTLCVGVYRNINGFPEWVICHLNVPIQYSSTYDALVVVVNEDGTAPGIHGDKIENSTYRTRFLGDRCAGHRDISLSPVPPHSIKQDETKDTNRHTGRRVSFFFFYGNVSEGPLATSNPKRDRHQIHKRQPLELSARIRVRLKCLSHFFHTPSLQTLINQPPRANQQK